MTSLVVVFQARTITHVLVAQDSSFFSPPSHCRFASAEDTLRHSRLSVGLEDILCVTGKFFCYASDYSFWQPDSAIVCLFLWWFVTAAAMRSSSTFNCCAIWNSAAKVLDSFSFQLLGSLTAAACGSCIHQHRPHSTNEVVNSFRVLATT
jgi:hypothetical protein